MRRALAYFVAFAGMGTLFAGTLWALYCHILTHVDSDEGMFGMVTALIVVAE